MTKEPQEETYQTLENKALEDFEKLMGLPIPKIVEELYKSHLQLAFKAGEEKGLNLRKAYNDPELIEQFCQQAITAERERIRKWAEKKKEELKGKQFMFYEDAMEDLLQELQNK